MRVTSPLVKPSAPKRTGRFFFDGLSTPVRARVAHQDAAGMTLRQELPFLQLHGRLRDEEGREGSLENVSVMVANGVPSLVLDIRYEGARDDATVPFLMESTRAMRATHALLRNAEAAESALPLESRSLNASLDTLPVEPHGLDAASPETRSLETQSLDTASPEAPWLTTGPLDRVFVERASGEQAIDHHPRALFAEQQTSFDPTNLPSHARKARRDETLPYGIQTHNKAADPAPSIPTVEELMQFTSAPSAPLRRRGGPNGWWARLWQRLIFRLFARA